MGDSNAAEGRMMGCGFETLLAAAAAYEHASVARSDVWVVSRGRSRLFFAQLSASIRPSHIVIDAQICVPGPGRRRGGAVVFSCTRSS